MKEIKCPLKFKDIKNPSNQELNQLSFIMAKQLEGLTCRDAHMVLTDAIAIINYHTTVVLGQGFAAEMTKYPPCLSDETIQNASRGRL